MDRGSEAEGDGEQAGDKRDEREAAGDAVEGEPEKKKGRASEKKIKLYGS